MVHVGQGNDLRTRRNFYVFSYGFDQRPFDEQRSSFQHSLGIGHDGCIRKRDPIGAVVLYAIRGERWRLSHASDAAKDEA